MASITGTQCDVCKRIEVGDTEDWLQVRPRAHSGTGERNQIDVCSNDCLIKLGRLRKGEAAEGRKTYTDDFKLEVVLFANEHSVGEAVDKYGVEQSLVYRWIRLADAGKEPK